jgi:hypothetical protein
MEYEDESRYAKKASDVMLVYERFMAKARDDGGRLNC